ncbi:MAG: hypothetical protein AAGA62_06375, partial [Bacteroidota bacterium]
RDSLLNVLESCLEPPESSPRLRVCQLAVYGQLLIKDGQYTAAYRNCKAANDLAVEALAEDDLVRGYAQAAYGCYLQHFQTPELAFLPLQQSLVSLPKLDTKTSLPYRRILNSTIKMAIELGQLEDAERLHAANLALLEAHQDTITLARFINTYGFFLQRAGHHQKAIEAFDEGIGLFDGPTAEQPRLWYVNLLESKAHALIDNQQFDLGIDYLKEAYFTRKSYNLNDWALQAMGYLINYWMKHGKHQEAYAFFRQEQTFFEEGKGLTQRKYKLYKYLGELMTHFGFDQEAATYFRIYNDYAANELLPKAEARLEIPNALSEFILLQKRTQEQEVTINKLEIDQLRKEVQLRQYGIALLGLSLGGLVLAVLGYRWYRRRTERERQRAEADRRRILELENENLKYGVATRERDLKRLAADNRLRTKLKRDILKQIEAINRLPAPEKEVRLSKLRSELTTTIEEQEAISQLQDQVEIINAAFEDRLREKISGITAQEIRYCSLLRLGMNNQQIAQLLNKSDATIRTYKHRITKKAGLAGRNALQLLVERL